MATSNDQSLYERLHAYDFTSDANFVSGWSQLRSGLVDAGEEILARKYLEAKVFYYSRCKENVSLREYMTWLLEKDKSSENGTGEKVESKNVEEKEPTTQGQSTSENVPTTTKKYHADSKVQMGEKCANELDLPEDVTGVDLLQLDNKASSNRTQSKKDEQEESTNNQVSPHYPTMFYELLEKVEKGEPIPGVEELDIEPTNAPVTKSTYEKIRKPWEQENMHGKVCQGKTSEQN